jgi:predicted DCC family thiol-disulfide oxidoreductase YuxK
MKKNTLYFSPLTGQTAKDLNLAGQMPLGYSYGETVVFYAKTQIYIKSEALIEALKYMKAPYCYLGFLLKIFPQKIRDFFYFQIARRRNMFFSNNMCFIPRQSEKKHFLP